MIKETHERGGYILALLILPFINNIYLVKYDTTYKIVLIIIYIYFAYLGSLFPDIDMRGSYISKKFILIYKLFGSRFRHRGFTHSLLALLLISSFFKSLTIFTNNNIVFSCLSSGFIIGYFSHMCLDLITKEGIELFFPITINISLLPIKTSSKTEKFISKLLNFIVIFLIGYQFYILF
ncbi:MULTISPECIES: metal-dependent hydrolase [unclassified Clostridioides]|uniref:metal-dependent hydrolase n=1 Tax=unclassified Clostridioides TaxID=2635829 RepID=UPI001D0CB5C7|nr:metal-dependent hydrolase [Clostridioides sp. ES-S-0001-02]MCC0640074.1 metal-dependent hydrolase [Clostridioides sp. ES-S-0049-03]MCC0652151.1 metal-dependent hydrolase [Clostridioides sp. ES-S-0001-03]MCC0655512.1 metal-dependent hydrolase [Clostridioides sp. ES-S-0123-01]MCC0670646.1 metal-dependent hydrolase [Clostridioides sp. ES-S-0145-01]MCC0674704.1 metal-dependent hydrolase [Clostridioides sp. ES-W-0018-02]MCC0679233.1 metal-dependent hydrolase [Clostridioides sp. ES-S-0005-03]MC